MPKLEFPKDFLWGASTAAHQVEGAKDNDWTEWEHKNASMLARESKSRYKKVANFLFSLPEWSEIEEYATDPLNYISGTSTDHYHRYKEDFDLAKKLNHNAHRFSLSWDRIEPSPGEFNLEELNHYKSVIMALKERGITPLVTLWHFANPRWVNSLGTWDNKKVIPAFLRYVEKLAKFYKDDIKYWITLNEPMVYVAASHLTGMRPPEKASILSSWKATNNLIEAHKKAYEIIKSYIPDSMVGVANNLMFMESKYPLVYNQLFRRLMNYIYNNRFIAKIEPHQDFIGINYYFYNLISWTYNKAKYKHKSDMGWGLYPEGIYHVLKQASKYKKPVIITEHGLADRYDKYRGWYIKETLKYVHKAIQEGVDVRGYLHWSLLDNFEWDFGFWPRFGLIEVDYDTLARKPRPSAYELAKIIKENGLEI